MAGKEKLLSNDIVEIEGRYDNIPPDKLPIVIGGEVVTMHILGKSNMNNLMPSDPVVLSSVLSGGSIGQYIATSKNGKIYDICVSWEEGAATLRGIQER